MKYEFVPGDEKTAPNGATLKRIRALVAIPAHDVAPGDLGGYIQSTSNLSHVGDAWVCVNSQVYGDAKVFGNAQVFGDTWVCGNAQVSGNAKVFGDARVYADAQVSGDANVFGNALVSGDAWVCGNAWVSGKAMIFWASKVGPENGTLTVYNTKTGELEAASRCFSGSIDDFLVASEAMHDEDTHHEYRLLIEVAHSRITRAINSAGSAAPASDASKAKAKK